jgi:hypothetical protein
MALARVAWLQPSARCRHLRCMRILALLLALIIAMPALAQDAPLPRERPVTTTAPAETEAVPAPAETDAVPLPRRRVAPPTPTEVIVPEIPPPAPPRIYQAACPALLAGKIEAEMLEPIAEGTCGERSPLSVTGVLVHGRMVPLSGAVTLNCGMASLLPQWAEAIDGYLMSREDTRLSRILVGTSYFCRNRNNATRGDLSEHGFANALDVVGFELEDGRTISLPDGWIDPLSPAGRMLRFAHDSACSLFTTTLGPEANALHRDHLHVDLGCHGQSCAARLCE